MSLHAVLERCPHVLLDFDGPMCATFSAVSSAAATLELGELLSREGIDIPAYLLEAADPFALLYYVAANAPEHSSMAEQALTKLEIAGVSTAQPTPGLRDLLTSLANTDHTVTVVSNNSAAAVQAFLDAENLNGSIRGVVARANSDPSRLKPDPHLLLLAASELGAPPGDCLLLGDSVTDVEAAHHAGTGSIAFANKPEKRDRFLTVHPDAIVSSLLDVADALTGSSSRLTDRNSRGRNTSSQTLG
ncbi:MAG TPA: HAD-IA family hydrolase [Mycobacterium sp.]|nr:HAD-IA family hydrolase [Mycobacterium sp.]